MLKEFHIFKLLEIIVFKDSCCEALGCMPYTHAKKIFPCIAILMNELSGTFFSDVRRMYFSVLSDLYRFEDVTVIIMLIVVGG